MVNVPPYAPSLQWYVEWCSLRVGGLSDEEAVGEANRICRIAGKEFARTRVASHPAAGGEEMILTVAVEGGASRLKIPGAERRARISLHGNWPHIHIGALEAVYGRTPYFRHIMPGIQEILDDIPPLLPDLSLRIHRRLSTFLLPVSLVEDSAVTPMPAHSPVARLSGKVEILRRRGGEIAAMLAPRLSVVDALMRFGPEITIPILFHYNSAAALK